MLPQTKAPGATRNGKQQEREMFKSLYREHNPAATLTVAF
jgi:hypothetical protein